MNKCKNVFVLSVLFIMICCNCFTSFAKNSELPDDFRNLSVEQRIRWLDENIPQTTEDAICISTRRIDYADYVSTQETYYYDEADSKLAGIFVTYKWRVNSNFEVESYDVSDFRTAVYNSSLAFLNKDVNSYYLTDSNVKIYSEAYFASSYMGIIIGQNVNLHGSGKISYQGVTQSY